MDRRIPPLAAGVASALMLTVLGAFPACAASPSFFNPNGVDSPATNSTPIASSKAGPVTEVSMGGIGTLTDVPHGPCSGTTCNASAGNCECLTFTGNMNGKGFGKVSAVMALTINDDDKTPTGAYVGFCFPSAGAATLTGKKSNVVVLAVTGLSCNFFPPSTYASGQSAVKLY